MRLFLALPVPPSLVEELDGLVASLRETFPGWRWVPPGSAHLTVRFLGEVSAGDDSAWRAEWRRAAAAAKPMLLRIGRVGTFPPRRAPRVLFVGAEEAAPGGRLDGLALAVEAGARRSGLAPAARPFHSHLTLARARAGARIVAPSVDLDICLGEMEARELVLFRSELGPGGSRYTPLERFPMGCEESSG